MKAKVTLTFDVDTDEYYDMIMPSEGIIKIIVKEMIKGNVDFPEKIDIDVTEI